MSRSDKMKIIFIICSLVVVSQQRHLKEAEQTPFELDDILNGVFGAKYWNGSWISDTAFTFPNTRQDILLYDFAKKHISLFLGREILDKYPGSTITSISSDLAYVLLSYNVSEVFRHSTTAVFTIYDIANKKYYDIANKLPLQLVTFAPKGHGLVYVFNNNIYYLEDFSVDIQQPITVTTVGATGIVYCGVPDWVYEEEVLSSGSALWFSPEATHLAFAVFHDESVRDFSYPVYGQQGTLDNQYPHDAVIKYPKVGTTNPLVSTYVYEIATKTTREFQLPPTINNKEPNNDYILYGLTWISNSQVAMVSSNRIQNESVIIRCLLDGTCVEETSRKESQGWIVPILPTYNKDGTKRLEILPQQEDDDRFDHLVLTDVLSNTQNRLTYGKFFVLSIDGWDEERGIIYYTASGDDSPSSQNTYAIDELGNSKCLTCSITIDGVPCGYGTAYFSKSYSYYTNQCMGPKIPLTRIHNIDVPDDILLWEDNPELKAILNLKLQPVIKDLVVPINDQFSARVRMFLPPNLNEQDSKKYPTIVDTYGGPGLNVINDAHQTGFHSYLVTNREYIYVYIDGRGISNDGYNKLYQMYRQFGTVEVEDQIHVTKYLQDHLPYIDERRTGIWGWSYGGFCSSWALAKDIDHVFLGALSVAPVTNFIYYDSIYTERYMGLNTPEDNEVGYNNTNLANVVEAFRGRNYFIIHGTGDDNVHYQNSMLFIKALELADIEFRQHSYPDENHSLEHVSKHLYHMMDKHWAVLFGIESSVHDSWTEKERKRN
ncbi:venom dipeptidyl peptidase 4-like [Diorhabda sublineata]|uniref:venom dipeptidyl peptidase 4-like n=1 Tax=Diorhabda sublineata TaxID=1163346 RepID=UPI0024E10713|nr:venom dipeptidyl peptidase 4-like [Diorhabda sublineata]